MQVLKDNLNMAQNRIKQQANQHRTEREFEVANWIFVRLQPYKQLSLKQQGKNKISPSFLVHTKLSEKLAQYHMN